ncbi:MAG: hypothetical protein A2Y40_03370 [Candidatus Margulisbacteria bacterium GWF2_35_9]|nr:MAG: hypothetical protein A2Y40_03370 [Candidatus Margulisbacteria bacterium GWF2_35_9]
MSTENSSDKNKPLVDFLGRSDYPDSFWKTSTPAKQDVDENKLLEGLDFIYSRNFEIHSLLIIRNQNIIFERYGIKKETEEQCLPTTSHLIHSCTKAIISALIGIAIEQGYIKSVHEAVLPYFKDFQPENMTEGKARITIEHVLTMRSGLAWGESDREESDFMKAPIPVKYVLDQKLKYTPGEVFNYSSGNVHILAGLLHRATGMKPLDFAINNLFIPLGIKTPPWLEDSNGTNYGCFGISMTARDMAKFAYLFINKGQVGEKQIIPESWVKATLSSHTKSNWTKEDFGYLWWIPNGLMASIVGAFGQNTYILPHHNMIVTFNANMTFQAYENNLATFTQKYICNAAN